MKLSPSALSGALSFWQSMLEDVVFRYLLWFGEKAVAPHSSTLAWKVPWTEEPGARLKN